MRKLFSRALPLVALLLFALGAPALAFHEGGVGYCAGCHLQHGSDTQSGAPSTGKYLTLGSDPSSTCLRCHSGLGPQSVLSTNGSALTPGGDFYWLKRTFNWTGGNSPDYTHGHNVVASDYGLIPDALNLTSPGGTYPSASLSCISCHDPHGKIANNQNPAPISGSGSYGAAAPVGSAVGNYRLLGGVGYKGGVSGFSFTNPAPVAAAPSASSTETDANHVAYGSGMSEWCANCHAGYMPGGTVSHHSSGSSAKFTTADVTEYDQYLATGNLMGTAATSYFALTPFETGATDPTLLDPTGTGGPTTVSNAMCLTCHRAHASAFEYIGRWDLTIAFTGFLVNSHPDGATDGSTAQEKLYSYYNRDIATQFGSGQKPFCEKCHVGGTP